MSNKLLLSKLDRLLLWLNRINWSSISVLTAIWAIIFSFQLSQWSYRIEQYEQKQTLLRALQEELALMTSWANDKYDDAPLEVYQKSNQHFIWHDPSLYFLSFQRVNMENFLTNTGFAQLDTNLVNSLVTLNQKIATLFEMRNVFEKYKFAYPDLFDKGAKWVKTQKIKNPKIDTELNASFYENEFKKMRDKGLKQYLEIVYAQNYKLYVCGIGSDEPLYKSNCPKNQVGIHMLWDYSTKLIQKSINQVRKPCFIVHFWISEIAFLLFLCLQFILI